MLKLSLKNLVTCSSKNSAPHIWIFVSYIVFYYKALDPNVFKLLIYCMQFYSSTYTMFTVAVIRNVFSQTSGGHR